MPNKVKLWKDEEKWLEGITKDVHSTANM
jgi:hypothetical protein